MWGLHRLASYPSTVYAVRTEVRYCTVQYALHSTVQLGLELIDDTVRTSRNEGKEKSRACIVGQGAAEGALPNPTTKASVNGTVQ